MWQLIIVLVNALIMFCAGIGVGRKFYQSYGVAIVGVGLLLRSLSGSFLPGRFSTQVEIAFELCSLMGALVFIITWNIGSNRGIYIVNRSDQSRE